MKVEVSKEEADEQRAWGNVFGAAVRTFLGHHLPSTPARKLAPPEVQEDKITKAKLKRIRKQSQRIAVRNRNGVTADGYER